ncbi:MAG: phosphoribosylanthranilate isomerase [Limisphaerales bacterium]|jgi:phosphoribosylanthranilate isomerase
MTRVKICGITRLEDGLAAAEAGADALGFMFYAPSKRAITAEAAAEIIRHLPLGVRKVGVFVDETAEEVLRVAGVSGIDTVQLHGGETPEYCGAFPGLTLWKAFRIASRASLDGLSVYSGVEAWLLDSYVAGEMGGTGAMFNWDLAVEAKRLGKPILLAGGLNPENAAEAVRRVAPFALDVSSGVESAPGRKDSAKVRAFIEAVRSAG